MSGNSLPVLQNKDFVLYWMIASRRTTWNFALDRAVEWAEKLRKPLVILEALRCRYPWASDRMHRFVIDGMAENACRFEGTDVLYYPYLELAPNAGKGLLVALASHACVVVTDNFPCFFLPRMVASAARQVAVLMEVVDSNGMLPIGQAEQAFPTAYAFRRFLQRELPRNLMDLPKANALSNTKLPKAKHLPREITKRWPKASPRLLNSGVGVLGAIPVDHGIPWVETRGGSTAAQALLRNFLRNRLRLTLRREMNQRSRLRADSLRTSISAICRCIRFFPKSQDKKDGLLSIWQYAQRAAAAVGGVQARLPKLSWTKSLPGESSALIVARREKTTTNSNHCRRGL
jgi:deoxyribodipyrimidine photo-lyase